MESTGPQSDEQRLTPPLALGDAATLTSAIAGLTRSGLPLPVGLRAAAAELPSRRSAMALRAIAGQLEAGRSLDDALARQASRSTRHVSGLLTAGLRSGDLATVLEQWISVEQRNLALRRQIRLVLAYPALLLFGLVALVLFFCEFVTRGMAEVIRDFGADLPASTEFFFWLSTTGRTMLWCVAAIMVFGPIVLWPLRRFAGVQAALYSVPLLGPLWWWPSLVECCGLLALLTERRLPLPAALDVTADAIRSSYVADGCRGLARDVASGRDFAAGLDRLPQFPPSLGFLLAWGNRQAVFPETCRAAADMFADRTEGQLNLVRLIVPPLAFVIVIATFAALVSAILLPLVSLISKLSG